ncbi:MAG TPA: serine/threonine-protein kinase [Pseudomonadota bacterium]|nr:serine/threonine-protein kinase [Pseudomonadota bacterium]
MLQPGQVVNGTYCVEQLLGSGGMADVYLVRHTRLPRQFALKLMLRSVASQAGVRERFRQEAEILAKLRHNHIVGVVDWDTSETGQPYLVMEYIEGETLANFLRRTGPLSPTVAIDICRQIGEGLSAAHAAGVIHRDLKPSNIFLDKNGGGPNFVKILDFGIAKVLSSGEPLTKLNTGLIGTPGYMSPEQVTGGVVDSRSDQFALGLILYEMLTARSAFCGVNDTALATLARIVQDPAPQLPQPGINATLQRALSKSPDERFPSINAFLSSLGGGLHTGYGQTLPPVSPPSSDGNGELSPNGYPPHRLRLRRILPATFLGVALAASAVTITTAWLRDSKRPARSAVTTQPGASNPPQATGPTQKQPQPPPEPTQPTVAAVKEKAPVNGPLSPTANVAPNPASPEPRTAKAGPAPGDVGKRMFAISLVEDSRFLGFNVPPAPAGAPGWVTTRIIQFCLEQRLKGIVLPANSEIHLERTNTLKVTAPRQLSRRAELELCLEQQFEFAKVRPPRAASVRVRYAQQ